MREVLSFAHSFIESGIGFTHQPTSTTTDTMGSYSPILGDDIEDDEQDIVDDDEDDNSQINPGTKQSTSKQSIVHKIK